MATKCVNRPTTKHAKAEVSKTKPQTHSTKQTAPTKVTFRAQPLRTLALFYRATRDQVRKSLAYLFTHPLTLWVCLPMLLAWSFLRYSPAVGPHLQVVEGHLWFMFKWFILGVLSSIGFGTGMHSGLLFLFPYVMDTAQTTYYSLWGENAADVPFSGEVLRVAGEIFLKTFPACFLWGAGTAVGEIPPFFLARATADSDSSLKDELEGAPGAGANLFNKLMHWMKMWMIGLLQKYGFVAILLLAAWPNAMFDLCGMACGHFQVPFWTFFGATFLGKAVFKVNMQAMLFILMCNPIFVKAIVDRVRFVAPPLADAVDEFITEQMARITRGHTESKSGLALLWQVVVFAFIGFFVMQIVEALAQKRAAQEQDEERARTVIAEMERSRNVNKPNKNNKNNTTTHSDDTLAKSPQNPSSKAAHNFNDSPRSEGTLNGVGSPRTPSTSIP